MRLGLGKATLTLPSIHPCVSDLEIRGIIWNTTKLINNSMTPVLVAIYVLCYTSPLWATYNRGCIPSKSSTYVKG